MLYVPTTSPAAIVWHSKKVRQQTSRSLMSTFKNMLMMLGESCLHESNTNTEERSKGGHLAVDEWNIISWVLGDCVGKVLLLLQLLSDSLFRITQAILPSSTRTPIHRKSEQHFGTFFFFAVRINWSHPFRIYLLLLIVELIRGICFPGIDYICWLTLPVLFTHLSNFGDKTTEQTSP